MFQDGFSKHVTIAINSARKGAGFPAIAIFQAERTRRGLALMGHKSGWADSPARQPGPMARR